MEQLNDNVQVLIDEAHAEQHSERWKNAVKYVGRIHRDLPDIISLSAQHLVDENKALAPKLANAAVREIGAFDDRGLSNENLVATVRRTHRNVLMQQAAEQVLSERKGLRTATDFMSLRGALHVDKGQAGPVAIETLSRQGIDARRLLDRMSDRSLKATSVGSYDRVESQHRDSLVTALEVQMPGNTNAIARQGEIERLPVVRAPRTQFATARRQPTFGRKIAAAETLHVQHAAAGMGL